MGFKIMKLFQQAKVALKQVNFPVPENGTVKGVPDHWFWLRFLLGVDREQA
jgi:hypothetical protein